MENLPYWHQQTADKPLYPDIEWSKPQQKSLSGRLGIIGGNKLGFAAVADNYGAALQIGVGEVRVLLPDSLKKSIPPIMTDVVYAATNSSGSLGADAIAEMKALGKWATGILMIGDCGQSSETAVLYENFVQSYAGPLIITRDAIDLLRNSSQMLVNRPDTLLVASFAQLQKLFSAVYYPKVLTFSMQLSNLVEAIHKFTITYPISIAVFHNDTLLVAYDGNVTSTPYLTPMEIWRGKMATTAAAYWLWNPSKPLESTTSSLLV